MDRFGPESRQEGAASGASVRAQFPVQGATALSYRVPLLLGTVSRGCGKQQKKGGGGLRPGEPPDNNPPPHTCVYGGDLLSHPTTGQYHRRWTA
ncbi:hypothetical protein GCM10022630_02270 [Thermobifida alba]